jgi:hypothetical protein
MADRVETIVCPTLVCDNPVDTVSSRGNTLYEALRCEKTLITLQPGGGHRRPLRSGCGEPVRAARVRLDRWDRQTLRNAVYLRPGLL